MTYVAPFNSAFVAAPVQGVTAISRVRRRTPSSKAERLNDAQGAAPTRAVRTPFDASSDATQAALSGLRLGG